jgi:hypothetical protein
VFDVLEPLEVGHSHTTTVAKHIRQEVHSLFEQDLFGLGSSRTVGSLNDQFTLETVSVVAIN